MSARATIETKIYATNLAEARGRVEEEFRCFFEGFNYEITYFHVEPSVQVMNEGTTLWEVTAHAIGHSDL